MTGTPENGPREPDWRQSTPALHHAQLDARRSCDEHPGQPYGASCPICHPPAPQPPPSASARPPGPAAPTPVTRGQAPTAQPDTFLPPDVDDWCPRHPGGRLGTCAGCRADVIAPTPSPHLMTEGLPRSRVDAVVAYLQKEDRRLSRHGGPGCACQECRDSGVFRWEGCECCGAAMRPHDKAQHGGLCRQCDDLAQDLRAGRPLPQPAPLPPAALAARAAVQAAKAGAIAARRTEEWRKLRPRTPVQRQPGDELLDPGYGDRHPR